MTPILSTLVNLRNDLLKATYAAIDLEWKFNPENMSKPYTLYAASIVDSNGKIQARHITDFRSPDTDSIFITDVKDEIDIKKFITECYIMLDIDVEQSKIYNKFLITKKKHYIGIDQNEQKEPDIKGMEGIKKDRPVWINKIERQFAKDIKYGKDPTINIRNQYQAMEAGQVPLEELEINLTLTKNPGRYPGNSLQRRLGSELDTGEGAP